MTAFNTENIRTQVQTSAASQAFVTKVYGWMSVALAMTAVMAYLTATVFKDAFWGNPALMIGLVIGDIALVWGISLGIRRMSAATAMFLFFLYSAINGIVLSWVLLYYTAESVVSTFFVTGGTFAAMAVYGHLTKRDLTSIGNLCFMALIGAIIASIVNIFVGSDPLGWAITYLFILVFVGLTAYHAQIVKDMSVASEGESDEIVQKGAVIGALALYLDFINLFLMLLRLLGRSRD